MQVTKNGKSLNYKINYSTKRKIYLRAKEDGIYVSCPKKTSSNYIDELILKYFDSLYETYIKQQKQEIIHYNGKSYIPKFFVGKSNGVMINDNEIWIYAKKNDLEHFKNALYDFYKKELKNQVELLLEDAKKDFFEVRNFPSFEYRYMKSMYGNYSRSKHHVKLSLLLAKYDFKFIKYVLYHELSHIMEMNHSDKFYNLFVSKYPLAIETRKEFKKIKYNDYI